MEYRREIDGLRALAVIPVILFHAGFQSFSGGFVGVDVFFVISGYLITSIILAEKQAGTFTIVNFYERRARRILPALFVVLFACLPFAWFWLLPEHMKHFSRSLVAVTAYASNILFFLESGYFETAAELKPLLHTWSLAVEEQYYVLFPIFLTLAWGMGKRWILAILALVAFCSLAFAEWGSHTNAAFTFFLLPTRGWELLIGAFIAFYFTKQDRVFFSQPVSETVSLLGLILVTYAIFAFDKQTPFPGLYALVPTLGVALIILFATQQTYVGKLLGNKVLVGLGLISYSAYLWHQPLFVFARHRSIEEPSKLLLLGLAVVALVLAYITWKFVETPFRNRKTYTRKQIFLYGFVGSVLFATLGLIGHFTKGFPGRFSNEVIQTASPPAFFTDQTTDCHRSGNRYMPISASCVLGDSNHVVGALIGDSHANAISTELGRDAKKAGLGLFQLTFNGCPSVQGVYRVDMAADDKCYEFNEKSYTYLKNNDAIQYVVIASFWTRYLKTSAFSNGEGTTLLHTFDLLDSVNNGVRERNQEETRVEKLKKKYIESILSLLNTGKKVILVYPVPETGWRTPDFLVKQKMFHAADIKRSTSYALFKERNKDAIDALDAIGEHDNLIRVYPDKILCNTYLSNRCVFELNGKPLYFDDNHLSNAGASLVNSEIIKYLK